MQSSPNLAALVEQCARIWRALESDGAPLDAADAANTNFRCKTLRAHFRTDDAWQLALKNAEPTAVGCLLALAVNRRELFRPLALQVLATPELHGDEYVVLESLRGLIGYDDESVFRAILPFCVRSWAGGWMNFARCPFSRRGEVLIEFLNDRSAQSGIQWTKLGEPAGDPPPAGDWGRHGDMLTDTFAHASPEVRQGLCEAGYRLFQRASTQAMRMQVAGALARMGGAAACLELCESNLETLREHGCHLALSYFAREFIERFGGMFTATDERSQLIRQSFHKSRRRLCAPVVDSDGRLVIIYQPRRWEPGNVTGENVICNVSLVWFDPKTGQQRHEVIAPARFEIQHSALSSVDGCGAPVILVEARISSETTRHYVGFDAENRLQIASTKKDIKARLSKPKAPPATKAKKPVPPPPAEPMSQSPEPTPVAPEPKKPTTRPTFEVGEVGRDRSSSEGKMAVSGYRHLAVFDAASGTLHFAPPRSVAIALGDSSLVSWRVERREDASGVGRGDYDWIVELYSFPAEPRFLRGYAIRSRDTIAWCWPVSISVPKTQDGRLVVMKARSEDFSTSVFIVLHDDGTFSETLDRPAALALLAGKDVDPAKVVSHRSEADSLPTCYPETALGRATRGYVAGLKRLGFDPLLRSGATPRRFASLAERLGAPVPDEVVAFLTVADGESDADGSALGGYTFLSTSRIEKLLAEQPRSPAILPIAKEPLRDNYVGVKLETGSVVAYGADEPETIELFPNVTAFLHWLAEAAKSDQLRFVKGGGDAPSYLVHRQGRLPNALHRTREAFKSRS